MTETTPTVLDPYAQARQATSAILTSLITEANEAARVVKSAANQKAVVADLIETADDPKVAEFRDFMDKASAAILKAEQEIELYVKENLMPKGDENDVEAATNTYKEKRAAIKGFTETMKVLDPNGEALKDLPELMSLGRGGNAGQTGVKRPRVNEIHIKPATASATEYAEVKATQKKDDGTVKEVVSFSVLAQKLKGAPWNMTLTARDILEHAEGVAGPAENWGDRDGEPFSFVISPENGEHVEVKVTP